MSSSNQWPIAAAGMIAASSVIMLAGCGGATDAPAALPRPGPTQAPSPSPPIGKPLDVTAMASRPCDVLTPQQATRFRLDLPPDQLTGLHGTLRCKWTTAPGEREIIRMLDVGMSTDSPDFDAAYSRDRGLPFFEITTVAGYPAIVTRTNASLPICAVKLKVAERQSISVDYEDKALNKNPQQSCEIGKQIAAAVLTNVPTKS